MNIENKPEWFQMADADRAAQFSSASAPKVRKRSAALLALTAPLAILGAGLVFAQSTSAPEATAAAPAAQVQSFDSSAANLPSQAPSGSPDVGQTPNVATGVGEAKSSILPATSSPTANASGVNPGDDNQGDENPGDDNQGDDNQGDQNQGDQNESDDD